MKLSAAHAFAASALLFSMFLPLPSFAASDKPLSKEEVETIVKQVIKDNPELIMKTVEDYQQKQAVEHVSKAAQNLVRLQDAIAHDPRSPSIGNPKGDVTVTEFFDYHCGYCKRFYPEIGKLIKDDKNIRIVFKEFPILSSDSELAARAALAVWQINKKKYFDFHSRLMESSGDFTEDSLAVMAVQIGVDEAAFRKTLSDPQLQKDIDTNKQLASTLAITGTPAMVVGTEFLPGAVSYDKLKATVDEVRDLQKHEKGKK